MFKVGDLVIGNSKNGYCMTCKGSICLVLDVNKLSTTMTVCKIAIDYDNYVKYDKVLDINPKTHQNDARYMVNCDEFDLFTDKISDNILTGLFFRKDVKKLVTLKKDYVSDPSEYVYIGKI